MVNPMGLLVSLILIAAGAILVWGVTSDAEGLNVDAIGVILMIVGLLGVLLSLLTWGPRGPVGRRRREVVESDAPVARRPAARRTVVEEDDVGPGPPSP
jgi:hypothetical protein